MHDPCELQRFVDAQDDGDTYEDAIAELRSGRKRTHWMWFVFPQLAGLGQSPMSRRYAVSSLDEARAYLEHPVLARRLLEAAGVVADTKGRTAIAIFGSTDAQKLHSSMTMFLRARPSEPVFGKVLGQLYGGRPDHYTDELLDPN